MKTRNIHPSLLYPRLTGRVSPWLASIPTGRRLPLESFKKEARKNRRVVDIGGTLAMVRGFGLWMILVTVHFIALTTLQTLSSRGCVSCHIPEPSQIFRMLPRFDTRIRTVTIDVLYVDQRIAITPQSAIEFHQDMCHPKNNLEPFSATESMAPCLSLQVDIRTSTHPLKPAELEGYTRSARYFLFV